MYILEKEVVVSRWICKRYSQRNLANDDGFICAGRDLQRFVVFQLA